MTAAVSRAIMWLAMCCLGESRREWALAMRAEFDVAVTQGNPFAFATGCLIAAWRELPGHAAGRLVLANYALALGVLIPMAAFQIALAFGSSSVVVGANWTQGIVLAGADSQNPFYTWAEHSAAPCLLALWLLLGIGHLRLAWVLVERDWAHVTKAGALIVATLATLFIVTAALFLDVTFVILQSVALAIEFAALAAVAQRDARLFPDAASEMAAP
jgi:hypothetical protein